jgi:peroxiredoxin (alkyl hydroperoxide reductase subunit C)
MVVSEETTASSLPQLGSPAPYFIAQTTQGTLALEDYKGRWLVLFSHPADFTPVCTSEFIAFTAQYEEFQKRGVDLLGLSIDSVYSHLAWLRNIEDKMGVRVPFPIVADLDKVVATAYGMVQPGQSKVEAARCVFDSDPEQVVRAMIYYPRSTGRNIQEYCASSTPSDDGSLQCRHARHWTPGASDPAAPIRWRVEEDGGGESAATGTTTRNSESRWHALP